MLAARAPNGGLSLIQRDEELWLAVGVTLQGLSLLTNSASLAESLYGLRRVSAAADLSQRAQLSRRERLVSLMFLVRSFSFSKCAHFILLCGVVGALPCAHWQSIT